MLVAFSAWLGSVGIGISRMGDILYISIGVVFLFWCLLRWPFFVFRWVVFQLGLCFDFGCFRKGGFLLQF